MSVTFTHLIMSSGGFSGIVYMGALRYLQQENYDKKIKHIAGTSVGALFATVFALDISMGEFEKKLKLFFQNDNNKVIAIENILLNMNTLGIDNGDRLVELLKEELHNLTFIDFSKKTGKDLVLCATNISNMQPVYFSVNTTPHVLVSEALKASMAIPFIIKPVKIGEEYYIDGAVTDGIPSKLFESIPFDNTIIFHIVKDTSHVNIYPETVSSLEYVFAVINSYVSNNLLIHMFQKKYKYYIQFNKYPLKAIPIKYYSNTNKFMFNITSETIDESISIGYHKMQEVLHFIKIN